MDFFLITVWSVFGVFVVNGLIHGIFGSDTDQLEAVSERLKEDIKQMEEDENFRRKEAKERARNALYQCEGCGKYSRRHNQELQYWQMKLDGRIPENDAFTDGRNFQAAVDFWKLEYHALCEKYPQDQHKFSDGKWLTERACPTCERADKLHLSYDEYPWIDSLPEAMVLNYEEMAVHRQNIEKIQNAIKEIESIKAFQEYHGLQPQSLDELLEKNVSRETFLKPEKMMYADLSDQEKADIHNFEVQAKANADWARIHRILKSEEEHAKRMSRIRGRGI